MKDSFLKNIRRDPTPRFPGQLIAFDHCQDCLVARLHGDQGPPPVPKAVCCQATSKKRISFIHIYIYTHMIEYIHAL